jgi:hypothetical protein
MWANLQVRITQEPIYIWCTTTKTYKTNIPLAGLVGAVVSELTAGGGWVVGAFGTTLGLLCAVDSDAFATGPSDAPILPRKLMNYINKQNHNLPNTKTQTLFFRYKEEGIFHIVQVQ